MIRNHFTGLSRRVTTLLLSIVLAGLAVSGCSQIDTLKPVAGDAITEVGIATGDVLSQSGVAVMTVPICEYDGTQYDCQGETVAGEPIVARTSGSDSDTLTVTVAGKQVFTGPIEDVIAGAAQGP